MYKFVGRTKNHIMKYYVAENGAPVGPFEINELIARGLTPQTQVWNESMAAWLPAGQVPELAAVLQQPIPVQQPTQPVAPAGQPQYAGAPLGRPQMGFGEAIKTCLFEKYFDFSGRARRSEFWWFQLFLFIVNSVVGGVFYAMAMPKMMDIISSSISGGPVPNTLELYKSMFDAAGPFGIVYIIISIACWIPSLAASVRRLHDTGRSGLWMLMLLTAIIPLLGSCVLLVFYVFLLIWWTQDSDRGVNKYGPSPKY